MVRSSMLQRRTFVSGVFAGLLSNGCSARADARRFRIGLANLDETPGVTLDGLGFTGLDLRRGFELAARTMPVDMVYFDNGGDPGRAVANAVAAIAAKVDLLIEYNADPGANAEIAARLAVAGIPALALIEKLPGAPLYGPDNLAAGHIAGSALGAFARENWPNEQVLGLIIGDLTYPGSSADDRVRGITEGIHEALPALKLALLDTGGQPVRADAILAKFLLAHRGVRMLIATLNDLTAVNAKNAIEMNRRQSDCVIVSQGLDRNIHGGSSEKKEIDPNNRASVVIGSVAYYIDRYGYDVLPLAMRMLAGETLPPVTLTQHKLINASNVFREYPPFDMN